MMIFIFEAVYIMGIIIFSASVLLLAAAVVAYLFNKIGLERIGPTKRISNAGAIVLLVLGILRFVLGLILIKKGEINMTSTQLILNIATMMHWASTAFIIVALVIVAAIIYSLMSKKGSVDELKKLLRDCVIIAVIFWVIAWLIL